jgi:zinc/manganese transport system substrate-binding protein
MIQSYGHKERGGASRKTTLLGAPGSFPWRKRIVIGAILIVTLAGCVVPGSASTHSSGTLSVVAGENEYGNLAQQIGGKYVHVTSIMSNPNTDPHTYEVSPSVGQEVSTANLVIENGLGYDSFLAKLLSASPSEKRAVIDVQTLLKLPNSTENPHLWYSPPNMRAVSLSLQADLSRLQPQHASYFQHREKRFLASYRSLMTVIQRFKERFAGKSVAVTEPVADYLLQIVGVKVRTPWALQSSIMNGIDPSPQSVTEENKLLSRHLVDAFAYNVQVTDPLTESFINAARQARVPIVAVYETMPQAAQSYQGWMELELSAFSRAFTLHTSTTSFSS